MSDSSPYTPPSTDLTEQPCPACGAPMQTGSLYSIGSIRWFGDGDSSLKKFLGGDRLRPTRAGRVGGHRCSGCRLILLREARRG